MDHVLGNTIIWLADAMSMPYMTITTFILCSIKAPYDISPLQDPSRCRIEHCCIVEGDIRLDVEFSRYDDSIDDWMSQLPLFGSRLEFWRHYLVVSQDIHKIVVFSIRKPSS